MVFGSEGIPKEEQTRVFNDNNREYHGDETSFVMCTKNEKVLAPRC